MKNYLLELELYDVNQTIWVSVYVASKEAACDIGYSFIETITSTSDAVLEGCVTVHDVNP